MESNESKSLYSFACSFSTVFTNSLSSMYHHFYVTLDKLFYLAIPVHYGISPMKSRPRAKTSNGGHVPISKERDDLVYIKSIIGFQLQVWFGLSHTVQSHTLYSHTPCTVTHPVQSHTLYSHTQYSHTPSTVTHPVQSHPIQSHTLYSHTPCIVTHPV